MTDYNYNLDGDQEHESDSSKSLPELKHLYGFSNIGKTDQPIESGNLIIKGDNLNVLKNILPQYTDQIDCIILDPSAMGSIENWLSTIFICLPTLFSLLSRNGSIYVFAQEHYLLGFNYLLQEYFDHAKNIFNIIWQRKTLIKAGGAFNDMQDQIACIVKKGNTESKYDWINQFKIGHEHPNLAWYFEDIGDDDEGKNYFHSLFYHTVNPIESIKPVRLIERILQNELPINGIVLDPFAGLGTTAHAILNLNHKDYGNRKFILIEKEEYAETITAEGVRRIIKGFGNETVMDGSFDYYALDKKR